MRLIQLRIHKIDDHLRGAMRYFLPSVIALAFAVPAWADEPDMNTLADSIVKGTTESRVKALNQAAELGSKARPLLRSMAVSMLDSKKEIRVAATSAMKPVDTTVAEIAAKLLLNFKDVDLEDLLKQGKDVVEPLVPILAFQFESIAGLPSRDDAALGKAQLLLNCLFSCAPNDPLSNKAILKALRSNEIRFQHTGVVGARSIKDGKSGIADVLRVAKRCPNESVRIDAVQTALELADKTNKEVIIKSLGELQLDRSEKIRKAVDSALEKLKEK